MKRSIATLFVALVAFPSAASAVPPDYIARHWAPPPLVKPEPIPLAAHLPANGTDVAAPDQQASRPAPASHLPAKGTDVAAPDQQASKPGPAPVFVSGPADSGFDWADAGVGAIAGTALAAFAIAGAAGLRRRPAPRLAG